MQPKILVITIAGGSEKYLKMEKASRETWARIKPEGVDVVYLKGNQNYLLRKCFGLLRRLSTNFNINIFQGPIVRYLAKRYHRARVVLTDDVCYVDVPDTWFILSIKMIKSLEFFLKHHDFDYIFRTNLGSYYRLDRLQDILSGLPRQGTYFAARVVHDRDNKYKGLVYGSGAGYCLSRDVVQKLVNDTELIIREQLENHGVLIDDMQFGEMISNRYGIKLTEGKSNAVSYSDLQKGSIPKELSDYHYYFTGNKDYRYHYLAHSLLTKPTHGQ